MKYQAKPIIVDAFSIAEVHRPNPDGSRNLVLNGTALNKVRATPEMLSRYTPVAGDYWVVQSNGYQSIQQRESFERQYDPFYPAHVIEQAGGTVKV